MDKSGSSRDAEDDQPSTSSGIKSKEKEDKTDDEMARLLQATDEILENKAKSMNLSSLNVRSILHHLIKYPSTIDVLLGIRENDDLPSVRNTRSRKRADDSTPSSATQTPKKFALRIEDTGPKNFLDLEYEEDDEFDEDYVVDDAKSPNQEAADSEMDVDDEEEEPKTVDKSLHLLEEEEDDEEDDVEEEVVVMTLNDTVPRADSAAPVPTLDNVLDDDDYRDFVMSLQQCREQDVLSDAGDVDDGDGGDDEDDEDYNVIADNLNVDDWDETRQDKTTQIPRHEVKALMMDTLLAEKEIPIDVFPEEAMIVNDETVVRKSQKEKDAEVSERLAENSSESCSLFTKNDVTFLPSELDTLKQQLEQHVQLLTQFVITCHHDKDLTEVHNRSQLMLNQLDDIRHTRPHSSIFEIRNLDAAIESCHEIMAMPSVGEDLIRWRRNTEDVVGTAIRPEAAHVLSRCRAVCFPELLPKVQPEKIEKPPPFLHEENLMLAMALLQFAHLPRRAEKGSIDRYTAIHQNCLPARSAYQIRSHLKTMRRAVKNPSPIHQIIQAAENGVCNIQIPPKQWAMCYEPIITWPREHQPNWYRMFVNTFIIDEDHHIRRQKEETMVLTPVKTERDEGGDFVHVGKGPAGQTVVMEREHIEQLVIRLIKEHEEASPSKQRRKNPTPMKLTQLADVSRVVESHRLLDDTNSRSSFPIPPTPGRRTPDEETIMMDLETHSMTWPVNAAMIDENPRTPRGIQPPGQPTDFSSMTCQAPMGAVGNEIPMQEYSNSSMQTKSTEDVVDEECSVSGLDLVPPDDEEDVTKVVDVPVETVTKKTSRKRTRAEREAMGTTGLDDDVLHEQQKTAVARKVIDDVKQRLFMHKLTWQRLAQAMTDDESHSVEKIHRIILTLSNHPELLNLMLIYAPPASIPPEFLSNRHYQNYKLAINMILDIERYITAAKLKQPSLRSIFRYIRSFLVNDETTSEEQVAARFFQLLGQDRPLWRKLESNFGCLPFRRTPRIEQFEYVDLTLPSEQWMVNRRKEKNASTRNDHFETIDDIDAVSSEKQKVDVMDKTRMVVKCGELCVRNEHDDTFVQLDVLERQWSRKDDITLLTRFNEAVKKDANFSESQIPALVPELQFGSKSIMARLQYLLSELKSSTHF